MKRLVMMVMLAACLLLVCGCGSMSKAMAGSDAKGATPLSGNKKVLIAYFSWSGNTKRVAELIKGQTQGDIYEIKAQEPYARDYQECLARAKSELANKARPALAEAVPDVSHYDVIMLGYPIWYGDAPMVISSFLEASDFTGKTIIPFATSGGSGIGTSVNTLKRVAPKAAIVDGKLLNDEKEISGWLGQLGRERQ